MPQYTEEKRTNVTITHDGHKEVRVETTTYKDGVQVGPPQNHRSVIMADTDVPQEVADHIERLKGKQPTQ